MLSYGKFLLEKLRTSSKIINSMKNIPISGTFYHGSYINDEHGLSIIKEFEFGYSDYNAIWITDDENIAKLFTKYNSTSNNDIQCVYKIKVKPTKKIAYIDMNIYKEILDYYGFYDLREFIEILTQSGYDGWKTLGSIDGHQYDDYAIFNLNLIYIEEVKFLINNTWTDYVKIELADEFLKNITNKNEN